MRIGLIINPTSRRGRGATDGKLTLDMLCERGVDVLNLTGGSAEESTYLAREVALAGNLDGVFVVGGDGTVHIGTEALVGTGIPMGIVAAGTGNDIARHFGLPRLDVLASLEVALSALGMNRTRSVDVIKVGDVHALSVVCCGLDADVNHRSNQFSVPKGGLRYIRGIGSALRSFEPYGMRIEVDGKVTEGGTTLVSIANTSYIGAGIPVAPQADASDGLLDIIVTPGYNVAQISTLIPRLLRGTHVSTGAAHHLRGRKITIAAAPEYGQNPLPIMADGDHIGDLPLTIECLPGALEILL